jgi:hypothetical protein
MTDREPLAKGKGKEIDDLEVETKLGEAVKKQSLLNLKVTKKEASGKQDLILLLMERQTAWDNMMTG